MSLSKMQQRATISNTDTHKETTMPGIGITDMPDPDGMYLSVIRKADFSKTYVEAPNIHNGDSVLITPAEYQSKLESRTIVMVTGHMKL